MIRFLLNGKVRETDTPPGSVALDYLRSVAGLKGCKEGCREGDCGVCSILLGVPEGNRGFRYRTLASCLLPMAELEGRHVVTIEGLTGEGLSPVQQAIVEEGATQCGFCTPGIVVGLTSFLLNSPSLSVEEGLAAVEGHLCRCTGYVSIRRAVERLVSLLSPRLANAPDRVKALADLGVLPPYFPGAREMAPGMTGEPAEAEADAVVLGGGTDLFVQRADALAQSGFRLLSRERGLQALLQDEDGLAMGGAVTVEHLRSSPELRAFLPEMGKALRLVSSQLIRNQATVAGNIVNASPIGDLSIMLLALDAVLELDGGGRRRSLPLRDFFKAYKETDLQPGEIIARIRIPPPGDGTAFHFEKVSRRIYLDIASVNTAVLVSMEGETVRRCALSAGGVGPVPMRLPGAEAALAGQPLTPDVLARAIEAADGEISPISDVRGSASYKRKLLRRLLVAHFVDLHPDLRLDEAVL